MTIDDIENNILANSMTPQQVFTQMRQHIKPQPDCIKIIGDFDNLQTISAWLEDHGMTESTGDESPKTGEYDWCGESLYIGTKSGLMLVNQDTFIIYRNINDFVTI